MKFLAIYLLLFIAASFLQLTNGQDLESNCHAFKFQLIHLSVAFSLRL